MLPVSCPSMQQAAPMRLNHLIRQHVRNLPALFLITPFFLGPRFEGLRAAAMWHPRPVMDQTCVDSEQAIEPRHWYWSRFMPLTTDES